MTADTDDLEPTTPAVPLDDAEGVDEPEPDLEPSPKNDAVDDDGSTGPDDTED